MKTLTPILLALVLLASCTSKAAIEPISRGPVDYPKPPLWVWALMPNSGKFNAGNKITITGIGFQEGAKAFIGDKPCLYTRFISKSALKCKVPDQDEPGDYSVTVMNPDGSISPIQWTQEQRQEHLTDEDEADRCQSWEKCDGLIYYYYIKPISSR